MLFYVDPHVPPELLLEHLQGKAREALQAFAERAPRRRRLAAHTLSAALKQVLVEFGLKMPQLAIPLRVALSGRTQTPSIDAFLEVLGPRGGRATRARRADGRRTLSFQFPYARAFGRARPASGKYR
jgi:glutamyl-tRNA synthetase